MLKWYTMPIGFLLIAAFALSSYAEEEQEDLIDIFESNNKLIAVIEGKQTQSFNLTANENVLWSGSKGHVGAFLTNDRLFVISVSSATWTYLYLNIDESLTVMQALSSYLILIVSGDRAIGYDAVSDRFIQVHLPIHDELITVKADKNVAVVITTSRVFGLSTKSSSFIEARLRIRESVEDIKTSSNKVIIRTSDRLLTFEVSSSTWNEHQL